MEIKRLYNLFLVMVLMVHASSFATSIREVMRGIALPGIILNLSNTGIDGVITQEDFVDIYVDKVKVLDLSSNKIEGIGPDAFKKFKNLQILFLGNNKLTIRKIDKNALRGLEGLWFLSVGNNSASSATLKRKVKKQLPKAFVIQTAITQSRLNKILAAVGIVVTAGALVAVGKKQRTQSETEQGVVFGPVTKEQYNKEQQQQLLKAAQRGDYAAVERLIDLDVNINFQDKHGVTALMDAIINVEFNPDSLEIAKLLINKEANVNLQTNEGFAAIHQIFLFIKDEQKIASLLNLILSKGGSVDITSSDGKTPLHLAVFVNQPSLAKILIEKGANINSRDHDGRTPIYDVIGKHDVALDVVETLLLKKVDINSRDDAGNTLLHALANDKEAQRNVRIVDTILSDGKIGLEIKNNAGKTALELARENKSGGAEIAGLIENYQSRK